MPPLAVSMGKVSLHHSHRFVSLALADRFLTLPAYLPEQHRPTSSHTVFINHHSYYQYHATARVDISRTLTRSSRCGSFLHDVDHFGDFCILGSAKRSDGGRRGSRGLPPRRVSSCAYRRRIQRRPIYNRTEAGMGSFQYSMARQRYNVSHLPFSTSRVHATQADKEESPRVFSAVSTESTSTSRSKWSSRTVIIQKQRSMRSSFCKSS
jgi:hypothetical protein